MFMVTFEEDANTLVGFGLTYNQAKIYAAIIRLDSSCVGSISKLAKVRREHVYRTLPKLEKMGLVERVLGIPEKIKATPVRVALSSLIKKQHDETQRKVSMLATQTEAFLKHIEQRDCGITNEEDSTQFSLVSERESILGKAGALIENAQEQIIFVTTRKKLAAFLFFHADSVRKAVRRGVRIQVITEMPDDGNELPRVLEEYLSPGTSLKLRYAGDLVNHYLIADNSEVLICTSAKADFAQCPYLWTNSSSLITLAQQNFENTFQRSTNWTEMPHKSMSRGAASPHSRVSWESVP